MHILFFFDLQGLPGVPGSEGPPGPPVSLKCKIHRVVQNHYPEDLCHVQCEMKCTVNKRQDTSAIICSMYCVLLCSLFYSNSLFYSIQMYWQCISSYCIVLFCVAGFRWVKGRQRLRRTKRISGTIIVDKLMLHRYTK